MQDIDESHDIHQSIEKLQSIMSGMHQIDLSENTQHHFADGMYVRSLYQPAGCLVVGKVHKREHFFIVAKGRIQVSHGDDKAVIFEAGDVFVAQPGSKRAILALEDSIYMNLHRNRTEGEDLDEIEEDLVETDQLALFDAHNRPRSLTWFG
jgi:quercetin dioxygenase-like cupin family protein